MKKVVRKKNVGNKRLSIMMTLVFAALIAALIMLFISGFGFIELIAGPKTVSSLGGGGEGAYVLAEIDNIICYYAEDYVSGGETVKGRYALSWLGTEFVTIHLPERYFESGDTIFKATEAYFAGESDSQNQYFRVSGTVRELDGEHEAMMYDWFTENEENLYNLGVIGYVEDSSYVLSPNIIEIDMIGGMNCVAVIALSIAAAVCLVFAVTVLILAACGVFDLKPEAAEGGDAPALLTDEAADAPDGQSGGETEEMDEEDTKADGGTEDDA